MDQGTCKQTAEIFECCQVGGVHSKGERLWALLAMANFVFRQGIKDMCCCHGPHISNDSHGEDLDGNFQRKGGRGGMAKESHE